jgi:hypothetical protein
MASFLAMITPLSSGNGQPPTIWPSPGVPTHPIAPGGPPPGYWGGVAPPYVDIGLPGPQPPSGAHPSHPIWRPDLGFWGGYRPPYVDIGPPGQQPGIWPSPGVPTHPIVLPPDLPPTLPPPDSRPIDWKTVWSPTTGWVVVGVPTGPTPTPSK